MENNFFCTKPVINVLLEPKKSSKVSSQLIYGEKFQIISRTKNYIKVKNFYDRYIGRFLKANKKIIAVGIAFSFQKYHKLPVNNHDRKLDFIITEKGVIK